MSTEHGKTSPAVPHGKICYLLIPALDIAQSAAFYEAVFGWHIRRRSDGATAFDDAVNGVSGTWVLDRQPASQPGVLIYIMVHSVAATIEKITAQGGKITSGPEGAPPEIIAQFSDPAGNIFGIGQE